MRYLLVMWNEQDSAGALEAEPEDVGAEAEPCWMPWAREMDQRGVLLDGGGQVQASVPAATVRAAGTGVLVADGPFAETKEQMAGYQIIECGGRDEAVYAASRHPVALQGGVVEVRELLAG
jgi:hypothetical protein